MTPQRHAEIRAAFLRVLELPPSQHETFLDREYGRDKELLAAVKELLAHHDEATLEPALPAQPESANDGASFASDTVASRYRIGALLGRGGMASVYLADDLTLGQSVAIKFLDARFATRRDWIEHFHNEVRLARIVTHFNVCRVFDIGETSGRPFLTMEYIEGENLATMLRSGGKQPFEKSVDIARQVCTGLAAAHGAGVLHRDLKPANIMIDEPGRVRITDFGIAVSVDGDASRELSAGTPAYMSPEQIAGREVDVRSDIYALGAVLYELFSGKPPFAADSMEQYIRLHESQTPPPLSEVVPDVDPRIEDLIDRCLRKSPKGRPPSALDVAAMLPGVDVLSVALSANQIPSPRMVAEASVAAVRVRRPGRLLLVSLACLALLPLLRSESGLPWEKDGALPIEVLRQRARETLKSVTIPFIAIDEADGLCGTTDAVALFEQLGMPRSEEVRLAIPANDYVFWLREAEFRLKPELAETLVFGNARVSLLDPPITDSGQRFVLLTQEGRFLGAAVVPPSGPERNDTGSTLSHSLDWNRALVAKVFSEAGLLEPVDLPESKLESRTCQEWSSSHSSLETPSMISCRASDRAMVAAITDEQSGEAATTGPLHWLRALTAVDATRLMFLAVLLAAIPLTWMNCRTRRIDLSGAVTMGAFVFAVQLLASLVGSTHVPEFSAELTLIAIMLLRAFSAAAIVIILYLALEPFARRYWPHLLIGWTRLLSVRKLDSLIWQQVLVGVTLGCLWALLFTVDRAAIRMIGWSAGEPFLMPQAADRLLSDWSGTASYLRSVSFAVAQGLLVAALLALVRHIVGTPLRTAIVVGILLIVFLLPRSAHPATAWWMVLGGIIPGLWVVIRFGLLSLVVAGTIALILNGAPLRLDSAGTHSVQTLLILGLVATVAALGYVLGLPRRSRVTTTAS